MCDDFIGIDDQFDSQKRQLAKLSVKNESCLLEMTAAC